MRPLLLRSITTPPRELELLVSNFAKFYWPCRWVYIRHIYLSYARKTQKTLSDISVVPPTGQQIYPGKVWKRHDKFTPLLQASCLPFGLLQHISGRPWYTVHYSHIRARQHLQGRILMISICRWGNWQQIVSVSTFITGRNRLFLIGFRISSSHARERTQL